MSGEERWWYVAAVVQAAAGAVLLHFFLSLPHIWNSPARAWLWVGAGLVPLIAATVHLRRAFSARQRRLRTAAGQCLACGYDLRGSAGQCPECGRDTAADALHHP